jgi:hypothetical protein
LFEGSKQLAAPATPRRLLLSALGYLGANRPKPFGRRQAGVGQRRGSGSVFAAEKNELQSRQYHVLRDGS